VNETDSIVTFSDLFDKSFIALSAGTDRYGPLDIAFNVLASFAVGMFIYFVYKRTYMGVLYQKSFSVSLILLSVVTTLIIMTISGNLVLSLGLVGALSIVRFRTPIKDSMDLVFLFWAISMGIANGVGYYGISVVGSVLIGLILFFMTRQEEVDHPYLLVMHIPLDVDESEVTAVIKKSVLKYQLKSKAVSDDGYELTLEVKLDGDDASFLRALKDKNMVNSATMVSYSGDLSSI
jgi:hypothetical protein